MRKPALYSLLLSTAVLCMPWAADAKRGGVPSFTMQQLNRAFDQSGVARHKIFSILTFQDLGEFGSHIAVLSSSRSGWHVTVLHNEAGGLEVEWKSGGLRGDFAVSSSEALEIDDLGDEQVVEFSGCAAHNCGGVDGGEFGMVLYAPRVRQAFFAHYDYGEHKQPGTFGNLDFSSNAMAVGNERYKGALNKAMRKRLGL